MKKSFKRQKIFSFLLVLCTTISVFSGTCFASNGSGFEDLRGYEWAEDAITKLKDGGIVNGNSPTTFNPGGLLKRAELAALLCRAFIAPNPTGRPAFADNEDIPEWALIYVEAARRYFYIGSDNRFRPAAESTREEIVYSLVKILDLDTTGVSVTEAREKYNKDWDSVKEENKAAIALATKLGIVSGDGNGRFSPGEPINRAEMAVLLYRAMKYGGGFGGGKFSDVKPGDWYYNAVMNLTNRQITGGKEDGTFGTNDELENRDLPKWLAKMAGEEEDSAEVISKIPSGLLSTDMDESESVIDAVYADDKLTREVAAYSLAKLCNLPDPGEESVSDAVYGFADKEDINPDYLNAVASVILTGYMNGSRDGNGALVLNPTAPVTKAQMAVLMVNALPSDGKKPGQVFSDVAPGDWFYDGVMYLYNKGIVFGRPDGTFGPFDENGIPDRTTLAALICRILDIKNPEPNPEDFNFKDPEFESGGYSWAKGFVWAAKNYFLYEDDLFYPTRPATRMEIAYAAAKLFGGYDPDSVNYETILRPFTDSGSVPVEYKSAMAYLVGAGIIKGTGEGELNPLGTTSRAEIAVFLARALIGIDQSKMKDYENTIEAVKEGEGQ